LELIKLGAFCEDATLGTQQGARYVNHFYDPAHGGYGYKSGTFLSSLAWGLEGADIGSQDYSFKDARNYFYNGFTLLDGEQRKRNLAAAFRSLGHVVHLVQDLAQPQHTRDDSHGSGSLYESFTERLRDALPFAGYPPVRITGPARFWHTADDKGLADYSNVGFVSAGTNFVRSGSAIRPNPKYAKPDGANAVITTVSIADLRNETGCAGPEIPPFLMGAVAFVGTTVIDNYAGTSTFNPRTSALSIFDEDLKQINYADLDGAFTLNRFTFCEAHKLLVPRAVAYSAGLINYFFRGQLEISAPDEGVYGIVDHTLENQPGTGGFRTLKLQLRNVTPGGTDASGQPLVEPIPDGGGTLVAVVKFHRNLCYQADLSGEYGSPGIDWRYCRSPSEEIMVSQPVPVPSGINDAAQTMTFTFANKVPIAATDVFLQVVYRGTLGEEADAVAVATRDISEPTYVYEFATADQYLYCANGILSQVPPCNQVYTFKESFCDQLHPELTYDQCKARYGFALKFRANPAAQPLPGYDPANPAYPPDQWFDVASEPTFSPVAEVPAPVGMFARVALLMDAPATAPFLVVTEEGVGAMARRFLWTNGLPVPTLNQVDPVTGNMVVNRQYAAARGVYVHTTPYASDPALSDHVLLSDGDASNIPPLTPVASQVLF
jgi:hypothetical protein